MTTATVGYVTVHREVSAFQRQPGRARRYVTGYQAQAGSGLPDGAAYLREAGPFGPGLGPATGWFDKDRSETGDQLWMAGQVLTLADGEAAQIAREAHADAAAIRAAADREAAAIREAAQREAAELKARLDWMLDELSRVLAAYVADGIAAPATPATTPTLPDASPTLPGTTSALPAATWPAGPDTRPGTKPAGPAKPTTTPAKPKTKSQKQGRQKNAMRVARYGTAALLAAALASGAAEVGQHGYKFFVFREGGQGQSKNNSTDQGFLAQQAAASAHHHAPKGRHHKPQQQTIKGKAHR